MSTIELEHHELTPLDEVSIERARQDMLWGQQDHVNLWEEDKGALQYAHGVFRAWADKYKGINDDENPLDWSGILLEEVFEALAEPTDEKLREELVQVSAVAVAWIECIDRRAA